MTALASQRRVQNMIDGLILPMSHPCKAGKIFFKGAACGLDATGMMVPMSATAGLRCVGLVDTGQASYIDTTGTTDGDVELKVEIAIWGMVNSAAGADLVTQAEMYKAVYFVDDNVVAKTDGGVGRPVAGLACRLEGGLVFVAMGFPYLGAENASQPLVGGGASNVVAVGALGLSRSTRITVDGTKAYTLANGISVGQRKSGRVTAAINTPAGTLTPASASGFTTISALDAVGDQFELEWNGTAWEVVSSTGVTIT
jgi:hypothetical protein